MQNRTENTGRQAILRQLAALDAKVTTIQPPACPDWCNAPVGHRYESADGLGLDAGVRRGHEHRFSPEVAVMVEEERAADGTVVLGEARVYVGQIDDIGVRAAYDLGDDVNSAAALAERINRVRS